MLHRFIRYSCMYEACMSPALNGNSVIRHFKHSNEIKIIYGITFDFLHGTATNGSDLDFAELHALFFPL